MSNCGSFQAQLASILEALAKSAIAEITKLVDDGSAALRFEMCRSQSENDMLRRKLLRMERELRAVRGYGEETPDNSLDISFEVQVCDEFGEAQIHEDDDNRLTPEKIPSGRAEGCCSVSMKMEDSRLQSAPIKREPVDGEQDWSESLLLSEDRVEEDPNTSQSQVEQKSLNNFGVSQAAAVDCGEGPLYEEEEGLHLQHCLTGSPEKGQQVELKQDPEGWPLNAPPNLLKVQCVWSEAGSLGRISGKHRPHGGKDKQRDVQVNLDCAEEFQGATPGNKLSGGDDSWDPGVEDCEVDTEASSPVSGLSGGDEHPLRTPSPETDCLTPVLQGRRRQPASEKLVSHGRRRLYDKKQYCLYCQKGYSKISRHLEHVHRREPDVASMLRLPKNSKERQVRLIKLRNQGNFIHNSTVAETGAGELVLRRRYGPKRELSAFRYCPFCKGLFAKLLLWRHVKTCKLRTKEGDDEVPKFGRLRVRSFWELSGPCPLDISEDLKKLVCGMADDEIFATMKEEKCILQLGENMLCRLGRDGRSQEYIRQRLRSVTKLLVEVRKRTPLRNVEDLLVPSNFPHIVAAVRGTAGFNEERNSYRTPSLARRLSYGLYGICCLVEEEALAKGNSCLAQSACDFRKMLHRRWSELIPMDTPTPLGVDKLDPPLHLMFMQDVKLLNTYLDKRLEELQNQVLLDPTKQNYGNFVRVVLAQVVLFNQSRQGAVSEMPLTAFTSRDVTPGKPLDKDGSFSTLDRKLCRHFARVELSGKGGEKFLVLLKPSVVAAMDLLVQNREACKVPSENRFMFARPGALSCYPSGICIRQFAEECGAENTNAISSVKLRKHVATILNVISLKESGVLLDLFSHDFEVSEKLLTEAATVNTCDDDLQLAELAKALLAMEKESSSEFSVDHNHIDPKDPSSENNAEGSADEAPAPQDPDYSPKQRILCLKHGGAKRKWEKGEVEAVERHLMKFIRMRKLPRKRDCLKCVQSEPSALRSRSWSSVKFYVKNRITASRK